MNYWINCQRLTELHHHHKVKNKDREQKSRGSNVVKEKKNLNHQTAISSLI
jgi:hypothetical protein